MKKLGGCITLIFLAMAIFTTQAMAKNSPVKVFVNGKILLEALYGVSPVMENGRVLVPIDFISKELGFVVEYTEDLGAAKIKKDDINIEIKMNSRQAKVGRQLVELDVKPFIKENSIFAPLRFIAENLGEEVAWDGGNKIVLVGKYKGEFSTDNTFLYTNEEYGYTLNFPGSWKDEAIIETRNGVLYVYDKKSAERFRADGVENFGPVFEIRSSEYPVTATVPYDTNYVLDYKNGNYLESIFDLDFQYYPETKDSYLKLWHEGQRALASFKRLGNIKLTEKEADNKTDYKVREILPGSLLKKIESQTNEKIVDVLYDDFSGEGKEEAFVITGNADPFEVVNLWFVTDADVIKLDKVYPYSSGEIIEIDEKRFVKYEAAYAIGNPIFLWSVEKGRPKLIIAGGAQNLNKEPDGTLTIEQNALDMMSDGTGRTIKQYWLYYDLGLCEYGGTEITPAQLLEFKGADNILKKIKEQDGIIKNILFRANNLININYCAPDGVNRYITLNYDFTTMSVSQIAEGEGVYLAALLPDLAVYPAKTK